MMFRPRGGNRRGVAQPGSASALGAEGRRFESCLPDHASPEGVYFDLFSVVVLVSVVVVCSSFPTLMFTSVFCTLSAVF
jgi:hypothetical protein